MTALTFELALLTGIAELLDTSGVGKWTPNGAPASTTGTATGLPMISLVNLPIAPERVICLTDYHVQANGRGLTDAIVGVQARIRGDRRPDTAIFIAGRVYDVLHCAAGVRLGSGDNVINVPLIEFNSGAPIGPDGNGRHERMINFYCHVNRPSANVTD